MDNFKKATRLQLRYSTEVGIVTTEQLWQLSLKQLGNAIKAVNKLLKDSQEEDDELDFLSETTKKDDINQLRFAILKEVFITKKSELDAQKDAAETKEHNQKILALIKNKQEQKLNDLSEEDLRKLLK